MDKTLVDYFEELVVYMRSLGYEDPRDKRIHELEEVIKELMLECGKCFADSDSLRRHKLAKQVLEQGDERESGHEKPS